MLRALHSGSAMPGWRGFPEAMLPPHGDDDEPPAEREAGDANDEKQARLPHRSNQGEHVIAALGQPSQAQGKL